MQIWRTGLNKAIKAAESAAETDVAVVASAEAPVTTKCPIVKSNMVDPVYSPGCNHVYSRAGIMSLLKSNGLCKCPMPGCGQMVYTANLTEHLPTKYYLKNHPVGMLPVMCCV
jgi:SUMO ligase MMS21 Smc5/6 complex component